MTRVEVETPRRVRYSNEMARFLQHGQLTNPGKHTHLVHELPDDVASLLKITRGHLVHDAYLEFHGLEAADFPSMSRETLTLEKRLDRIFAVSSDPLSMARPASLRQVGTCRDYAVMLCGFLREKSVPARVRCGFASYFSAGRYEDHWVCEHWVSSENRWAKADAQLDREHRQHLGVMFDTSDLPQGKFLTSTEAWQACRSNALTFDTFGHGDATGGRFLWINLARDYLSLNGQESSDWDGWRAAFTNTHHLDNAERKECNTIAMAIGRLEALPDPERAHFHLTPFWLRD